MAHSTDSVTLQTCLPTPSPLTDWGGDHHTRDAHTFYRRVHRRLEMLPRVPKYSLCALNDSEGQRHQDRFVKPRISLADGWPRCWVGSARHPLPGRCDTQLMVLLPLQPAAGPTRSAGQVVETEPCRRPRGQCPLGPPRRTQRHTQPQRGEPLPLLAVPPTSAQGEATIDRRPSPPSRANKRKAQLRAWLLDATDEDRRRGGRSSAGAQGGALYFGRLVG